MQFFVTPFFLKSAKLTKNCLKVMECATRSHLNIRNTYWFKALTANFFLSYTYSFTKNSKYVTLFNSLDFGCIISFIRTLSSNSLYHISNSDKNQHKSDKRYKKWNEMQFEKIFSTFPCIVYNSKHKMSTTFRLSGQNLSMSGHEMQGLLIYAIICHIVIHKLTSKIH